ncbi:MAG: ComEA family DNA-binding protein [Myxococcota bacterium]|nr:ComEA family DNA-binding protein [Myxococcota bacterium]
MFYHCMRAMALFLVFFSSAFAAVNINTASVNELDALPGIGPSKAAAIVAHREANGPFASCSALTDVKGIGAATLSNIASMCTIGDGAQTNSSSESPPPAEGSTPTTTSDSTNANAININTASATELDAFPGIGPSKAAAIVAFREANGPFSSCTALTNVQGIGSSTVEKLAALCTTGSTE